MALPAGSIRFTPSALEISGFLSPFRTTTTIGTDASGVSLLAITFPDLITSSYGGCTTGTSKGAPCTTCLGGAPAAPMVGFMTCPVFFSKPGFIRSTGHRMPPGAIRVTSSACNGYAAQRITAVTATEMSFFMGQSLDLEQYIPNPNPSVQTQPAVDS